MSNSPRDIVRTVIPCGHGWSVITPTIELETGRPSGVFEQPVIAWLIEVSTTTNKNVENTITATTEPITVEGFYSLEGRYLLRSTEGLLISPNDAVLDEYDSPLEFFVERWDKAKTGAGE